MSPNAKHGASPPMMAGAPPFRPGSRVVLANWQDPPFNRWAFQHVRELIPTARIARGGGPVWRLRQDGRDIGRVTFRSGQREMTIAQMLAETYTDGFLVVHHGRIVAELYFNGMAPDTTHLLMSVSKSVTSAVAGALWGRGMLDTSSHVTDIVPELGGTSFEGATVQHLLDMRAGTRFNEDYDDPEADVRASEPIYLWRPRGARDLPDDALTYFAELRNDGQHGGPFRYRSILTDVLAWVVEKAAGARFHEVVARELWQPMGAEFDAEVTVDAHGNPMADGGICATLRDLARFGQLYLQSGRAQGHLQSGRARDHLQPGRERDHLQSGREQDRQIVPAAWVDDTIRGAADGARAFVDGDNPPGFPSAAHYRNCWWVPEPDLPFYYASGINGQNVFVHMPSQTVIVKLSTWPVPESPSLRRTTIQAVRALARALAGAQ